MFFSLLGHKHKLIIIIKRGGGKMVLIFIIQVDHTGTSMELSMDYLNNALQKIEYFFLSKS